MLCSEETLNMQGTYLIPANSNLEDDGDAVQMRANGGLDLFELREYEYD